MSERQTWLCLSGGNALGAYQAGAIQALLEAGVAFDRVAGASIGAVNGALIVGNHPQDRVARLNDFWRVATETLSFISHHGPFHQAARMRAAVQALLTGNPGLFRPSLPGLWSLLPLGPTTDSLFEASQQRKTLQALIDFDLINHSSSELHVTAVDTETGEDVDFLNRGDGLTVEHIMASTAFPFTFPLVEIDGRHCADPGLSANLPLASLFFPRPEQEVVCICLDLFRGPGLVPHSLDQTLRRTIDIVFASQSRHAILATKNIMQASAGIDVTLIHSAYGGADEIGLKMIDYSAGSIRMRRDAGYREGQHLARAIGDMPARRQTFDIWRTEIEGSLRYWDL
ncbi:patatin-like phospholipase family protein [Rhizobium sp. XQZ8]|uniref:patatin-like phospholipase family protein n=1 Tax=Rhizobium populisoli TaxID=2859785 RepID=UPI001CA531F7|nr:patatin-like phospholipase family protein [Rhizobium populisoli]MBW6425204.1 patatin-like phospholipase family protein [Rhizobium populisoli]